MGIGIGQSSGSYWTPQIPTGLTLTVISDTEIQTDWTNVDTKGDGAKLYISTDNVNFTLKSTVALGVTTANATGLIAGTLYYFYVVSYKGSKLSDPSSIESATCSVLATGGTEYVVNGYKIHKFLTTADLVISRAGNVEILIVAGGGGGGNGKGAGYASGGGGGAGGLIYRSAFAVPAETLSCAVGGGGAGGKAYKGDNGQDSVFSTLIAIKGGGGGGSFIDDASIGGSGGGGGYFYNGKAGTTGQGKAGGNGGAASPYPAGGGGGAGQNGDNYNALGGGNGGDGLNTYSDLLIAAQAGVDIAGVHWIAGGGGGGMCNGSYNAVGGKGGGGGTFLNSNGFNATANTGGGGGGGGSAAGLNDAFGGDGGSGIIIIRYKI
jgi:hypothetical protein